MPRRAKKSLGQNYLVNDSAARRIVEAVRPAPEDLVFEIGPGRGALTRHLASSGAMTVSFEIDRQHCRDLDEAFSGTGNVSIVEADVLDIDFDGEARKRGRESFKIVGNIPYMLTSSVLIRIPGWKRASLSVIMVQKEVADRILEEPGNRNCGVMTVFLKSYLDAEKVLGVRAGSFRPSPRVDSTVCRFRPVVREGAPADREQFLLFLKLAFSRRRKKLRNSLLEGEAEEKRRLQERLEDSSGVDMNRRAENLKLEEWFSLFESFRIMVGFDETE
ncbi:MAG: ribosomal RNA small subunit methyltransferase A [Candidatus Latescibacteria bacterium]|nr:ribosomal RNA small subunit methyltransferase A [bacterium]MBD3422923.1 ribosomal RNA small subunit methyltransferase A [Candidatus Latescibacterota bacterium]